MTQPLPASQTQSNSVGNANVGGNFIFNPTQIIQISVAEVTRKALIKSSPYKGLEKFNYKDREFFFGRDKLIKKLLTAVSQSSFSLVLGASGSGKSSLVRAGLIYELEKSINSKFYNFIFTPNNDPFESLYRCLLNEEKDYKFDLSEVELARTAKANTLLKVVRKLKKEGDFWVIFIDQFEEMFTRCPNDKRNSFIEGLVQVALLGDRSLKIVLAMRSDFLEQFSFYPKLGEIANQNNIHLVTEMYPDELREAIEQPAAKHGVVFEEGLVEQIIQEVKGQKGYLPLLQYTLDLLWQKECHTLGSDNHPHIEDRTLNKASYTEVEGVRGALQTQVDQIYKDICKKYQDGETVTKQIFVKLVNITNLENKIVSRRAYQNEFVGNSTVEILNVFINSKLLVSSCDDLNQSKDATVEIAHEILLSSWNTLKNWIEEEKEAIKLKNLLADETNRWQKTRQENKTLAEEELLKGYRLAQIVSFREKDNFKNIGGLSSAENEFIDVSVAWRDRQRNREKRRNQIIRITAGVSVILALFAGHQWRQSELEQIRTLTKSSEALMLSNQTLSARIISLQAARKLEQSIWQAVAPKELHNQVLDGLVQTAYGGDYTIREYNRIDNTPIEWSRDLISWSPNGDLAFASGDNTVKLHKSDGTRKTLTNLNGSVFGVSWSVDNVLAVASGNTVTLWNRDGDLQGSFELPQDNGAYYGMRWSPDGRILAFPTQANTALLLRRDGQIISPLGGHTIGVFGLGWSDDGMLTTASGDGSINLWKWDSNEPIKLNGHSDWVIGVSWSRDGILASASQDGTVKLWNRDGELLQTLDHSADVTSVSWSRDGILAAASSDKKIRLWKPDGTLLTTLRSHGSVQSLAWSADGKLASASKDGTVQLWQHNPKLTSLLGHTDAVNSVSWSRDVVASGSNDGTVKLWQLDGTLYRTLDGNRGAVRSVSWSVEGLAAASFDQVQLWKKADNYSQPLFLDHSQHRQRDYQNLPTQVKQVSWSSDGQYLASATWGATVQWWDRNGNWQAMYEDRDWVEAVSWSRQNLLAIGVKNGYIKIFNADGTLRQEISNLGSAVLGVSWSSDGEILASANPAYLVRLWNQNGDLLDELKGHEDDVLSVSWHPTKQILASASKDGIVKLWKRDGTPIMTLKGHTNAVNEVNWSPDGKFLATASSDKTVKLWHLDINLENDRLLFNTLLAYNCNWLRDYFKTNPDKINSDRQFCNQISAH